MTDLDFIQTACIFCENPDDTVLFPARLYQDTFTPYAFSARRSRRREHYRIVQCRRCGLVRSNPILEAACIESFYADSLFCYKEEATYATETYAELFNHLIRKNLGSEKVKSLLEIGCGNGLFLEKMKAAGVENVLGFEPSRQCYASTPKSISPFVVNDVFRPEKIADQKFDLICAFHVFDHLVQPKETLASLVEHLGPGGMVLLVCHDVEAWSARILGTLSPVFDVEHIYLYSPRTILRLVESCGLQLVTAGSLTNRYPLSYWVRMAPLGTLVDRVAPQVVREWPISLKAGNLYVLAQNSR